MELAQLLTSLAWVGAVGALTISLGYWAVRSMNRSFGD